MAQLTADFLLGKVRLFQRHGSQLDMRDSDRPNPPNWAAEFATRMPATHLLFVGVVIVFFWLALYPYAANYFVHHPDERHYTDGALAMIHTGDYMSPRQADGTYRFRKPVLTYWCVAASYHVLGINPLASRLPFFIAGGAVIFLTYRLAWMLCQDRLTAGLAAVIMMGHPILLLSSTRSIPDVLLCLFLLLSEYGFLGIIAMGSTRCRDYAAAYVGCGLAVASKGLPAVAFATFVWAFVLWNPWHRIDWKRLIHVPSMIVGTAVALSWFAVMFMIHGPASLQVFWSDQVTSRVTDVHWKPIYQFPLFLALCAGFLLPWSLPVLSRARRVPRLLLPTGPGPLQAARFILLWTLTFSVFAAMVTKFSTRYVLPVSPLLAILLAMAMARIDATVLRRWLQWGLIFACAAVSLLGTAVMVTNVQAHEGQLGSAVALGLVVACFALTCKGLRAARLAAATCLSMVMILAYPLVFLALRHYALPDQGEQIARRLQELAVPSSMHIHMVSKPALASKVRVASKGLIQLSQSAPNELLWNRDESVLVLSTDCLPRLDMSHYRLYAGSEGLKDLQYGRLLFEILRGRLTDYVKQRRQRFVIGVRARREDGGRLAEHPGSTFR